MGVMTRMRSAMPVVVIGAAVMFILLIVLEWGMNISDRNRGRVSATEKIGVVNGADLAYKDFESDYNKELEAQKQQQPTLSEETELQVRDGVWQRFVSSTLVKHLLNQLDLEVTDEQVRDVLVENPPSYLRRQFTDSLGNFDLGSYQNVISNIANYQPGGANSEQDLKMDTMREALFNIEDNVRQERVANLFQSVIGSSVLVTEEDVRRKFNNDNSRADAAYFLLDESRVPNEGVVVNDEDVKLYYDKNAMEFMQKPVRMVRAAFFYLLPSISDSLSVTRKFQTLVDSVGATRDTAHRSALFAQFSSRYNEATAPNEAFMKFKDMSPGKAVALLGVPVGGVSGIDAEQDGYHVYRVAEERPGDVEYARFSEVMIPGNSDSTVRVLQNIKSTLETRADATFEEAAQRFSKDASASRGGDAGYAARGTLPASLDEAIFKAPLGTVVGPIVTESGCYLVKVVARGNREVRVQDILMTVHTSSQTRQTLEHKAQEFRDRIVRGENMDTVGAKLQIRVFESPQLMINTPFLGSMDFTNWAFTAKKGEVSELKKVRGNVVVMQLSDVREKGVKPFEEVKPTIRQKLVRRKKYDNLEARARSLSSALRGDSLEHARIFDTSVTVQYVQGVPPMGQVQGLGQEPAFNAALYSLQNVGQISDPARGQRGVYIVQLRSKAVPSDSMYALQQSHAAAPQCGWTRLD
jgi:peptidyl-prolyl cis-trans isomerase D